MIWANSVLPMYIVISSSREAARLHDVPFAVQVGDTMKTSECSTK